MTGITKAIRNFFGTTRAQTNGFVGLLIFVALVIFSEPVTRWWVSRQPKDFSRDQAVLDSLTRQWQLVSDRPAVTALKSERVYFEFDPNVTSKDQFSALGFHNKLISRIINYRNKGGRFRIKSDLRKIYGMDTVLYQQLYSYIRLPEAVSARPVNKPETVESFKHKNQPQKFNLNEADTVQLEKIFGIGPKLALRIVRYRDKLGGFVSHDQLKEVYGLDSTVVAGLTAASYLPEGVVVKTIHVNTAPENVLAAHPYFGRRIASAIVAYRFQHGNFKSVDDLGKIPLIDKAKLEKMLPYLTVDP